MFVCLCNWQPSLNSTFQAEIVTHIHIHAHMQAFSIYLGYILIIFYNNFLLFVHNVLNNAYVCMLHAYIMYIFVCLLFMYVCMYILIKHFIWFEYNRIEFLRNPMHNFLFHFINITNIVFSSHSCWTFHSFLLHFTVSLNIKVYA